MRHFLFVTSELGVSIMGRGNYYTWWRKAGEAAEALFYANGWAARGAYALGLQGRLRIDRREVPLPLSDPLAEPLRVAFASDFHAGPLTDPRLLDAVVRAIDAFAPHVLLLGGDFVSLHHRHVTSLAVRLRELRVSGGMFGVYGNHDLWVDDAFVRTELELAGVRMLVNESVRLPAPFDELFLCGLDEPGVGQPDPAMTFKDAGPRRILLMHSPLGLKHVHTFPFDLAFCGHTHGGQIALPWGRPIVLPSGSGERRFANGHFMLPEGARLVTSRGVGMSDVPVRLFSPSEVHLYTIRAAV
ncbi:metallophosphoesterase family protein [Ralstonia solanacearum]|uniref:Metallophosphoesterase family protein n=1 Tax=Ralstonia solanacearum TaxID=305 RepID=A0AAW5ZNV0_RALSL|nr:metallophosphoesterase [Ralstonia solanacearum]MDB0571253.1 metallophosphoesterase family protein [Ralstonia solanacearum]